jgi:anti-anti-sigma regulatory factor
MSETNRPVVERVSRKTGDRLRLTGAVTAVNARVLRDAALASLQSGKPITVDAEGATYLDAAVAQVLIALRRSCLEGGVALQWKGPAPSARDLLVTWGLGMALEPVEAAR